MSNLVTLAKFKEEIQLWNSKGHINVVDATFDDGDMILTVQSYIYPDNSYYVVVPFNTDVILSMDMD